MTRFARVDPADIQHSWDVDGWGAFRRVIVAADAGVANTPAVVSSRGRITGHPGAANGNLREALLRNGTRWANSEITSLWWGTSVFDAAVATPQMGHIHRAVEVSPGVWSGYVVTNAVFGGGPDLVNVNCWTFDGTNLTLGSNGASTNMGALLDRVMRFVAVSRFEFPPGTWLNNYFCNGGNGPVGFGALQNGDLVTIDAIDATFDEANVAIASFNLANGTLLVQETTTLAAVATKFDSGTITPKDHRRWWPYWVKSQLVGQVLRVKVWPYETPEVDWGVTAQTVVFDAGGANNPLPNTAAPKGAGFCGVMANHLRASATMDYGTARFRQL